MTIFEQLVAAQRLHVQRQAKELGLQFHETEFPDHIHFLAIGPGSTGGEPYHPVRFESQVWKPLNADHSVAELGQSNTLDETP